MTSRDLPVARPFTDARVHWIGSRHFYPTSLFTKAILVLQAEQQIMLTFKWKPGETILKGLLDLSDLAGDHTEHLCFNSVELIEATPSSTLDQA